MIAGACGFKRFAIAASAFIAANTVANAETYHLVDPQSRVIHATFAFDGGRDGKISMFDRWCGYITNQCPAGGADIPASYERYFTETDNAEFDIHPDLNLSLGLYGPGTAAFGNPLERTVFRTLEVVPDGEGATLPPPEISSVREIQFPSNRTDVPISVRFPRKNDGLGAIIELPAGWCGQSSNICVGNSFEVGQTLHDWVRGQTSQSEPFLIINDLDIELERSGDNLSVSISLFEPSGKTNKYSFSGAKVEALVAVNSHGTLDCTPIEQLEQLRDGAVWLHIIRDVDNACIGRLSWAVIPDPDATMILSDGWCGTDICTGMEARSGPFRDFDARPTRFWEGPTNGPSITITQSDQGFDAPVTISSSNGRVIARILPEYRNSAGANNQVPSTPVKR